MQEGERKIVWKALGYFAFAIVSGGLMLVFGAEQVLRLVVG